MRRAHFMVFASQPRPLRHSNPTFVLAPWDGERFSAGRAGIAARAHGPAAGALFTERAERSHHARQAPGGRSRLAGSQAGRVAQPSLEAGEDDQPPRPAAAAHHPAGRAERGEQRQLRGGGEPATVEPDGHRALLAAAHARGRLRHAAADTRHLRDELWLPIGAQGGFGRGGARAGAQRRAARP
eukprot:1688099-Prymnesium_polylepis.1